MTHEISDKIKDWHDMKRLGVEILRTMGQEQRVLFDKYVEKGLEYYNKYGERYNPKERPI